MAAAPLTATDRLTRARARQARMGAALHKAAPRAGMASVVRRHDRYARAAETVSAREGRLTGGPGSRG